MVALFALCARSRLLLALISFPGPPTILVIRFRISGYFGAVCHIERLLDIVLVFMSVLLCAGCREKGDGGCWVCHLPGSLPLSYVIICLKYLELVLYTAPSSSILSHFVMCFDFLLFLFVFYLFLCFLYILSSVLCVNWGRQSFAFILF